MVPRIMVDRPATAPQLPFEAGLIIGPDGRDEPGLYFWMANAWVSNAVSAVAGENYPLAAWVCRTLNDAVIREHVASVPAAAPQTA